MEADKMFEELGYVLTKERFAGEVVEHRYQKASKIITFKIKEKYFIVVDLAEDGIDMQELKAINKKCEELGWI